jgi:hypothetical protein
MTSDQGGKTPPLQFDITKNLCPILRVSRNRKSCRGLKTNHLGCPTLKFPIRV